jgi:hypothetical protein
MRLCARLKLFLADLVVCRCLYDRPSNPERRPITKDVLTQVMPQLPPNPIMEVSKINTFNFDTAFKVAFAGSLGSAGFYCGRDKGKPKGRSLNWGSMAGREGADLRDALGRKAASSIL